MPYGFSERMAEEAEKQFPPMPNIIIYTTASCPKCHTLKTHLTEQGIDYTEMDLTNPAILTEIRLQGYFGLEAPVLQVGSRFYGPGELFDGDCLNKEKIRGAIGC